MQLRGVRRSAATAGAAVALLCVLTSCSTPSTPTQTSPATTAAPTTAAPTTAAPAACADVGALKSSLEALTKVKPGRGRCPRAENRDRQRQDQPGACGGLGLGGCSSPVWSR